MWSEFPSVPARAASLLFSINLLILFYSGTVFVVRSQLRCARTMTIRGYCILFYSMNLGLMHAGSRWPASLCLSTTFHYSISSFSLFPPLSDSINLHPALRQSLLHIFITSMSSDHPSPPENINLCYTPAEST